MDNEAPVTPQPGGDSAPAPAPAPASTPSSDTSSPDSRSDGESKESLLSHVLKVVPTTPEPDVLATKDDSGAPTPQEAKDADQAEAGDEADDDAPSDDEPAPSDAPPALRKKINKLLRQRRQALNKIASLEPRAQIGSELEQFASTNDLSGDDIIMALQIAATLRQGDYESFYRAVGPYVRRSQEYLGVVLPDDLQQRVNAGHMTGEAAYEFARLRMDQERATVTAQESVALQRGQALQSVQSDVQRAVTNLEHRIAASDPDYKAKADAVRRAAQAMLFERGGTITSVQDALEITNAAYKEVNNHFRKFQPAVRPTTPAPNGHAQSSSARPAPKTLMEAALQGLQDSRRAG